MSLRFQDTHRTVIQGLRNTGINLPWLNEGTIITRTLRHFYNFLLFFVVLYQLVLAAFSAMKFENFIERTLAGAVVSIETNPTMLSLYYALCHMRIKKFLEHSDELNNRIMESGLGQTENFQKNFLAVAKKNNSFTRIVLTFVFWTPIFYTVPRLLIDVYNGSYRETQPMKLIYPFDEHKPGYYEITFVTQTLGLLCGDVKKFANDCFFLTVFRAQTVYLTFLSDSVRDLGEEFKKSGDPILKKKLTKWIELHQHFIRNFRELISLYTPVICIYYANLICTVVLCLFTQMQKNYGLIDGIGLAGFLSANIFQLYLQCATNDDFSFEAENVALEIYKTPWYEFDDANKGMVRTMFLMASKRVEVTAFKSPTLRLDKEAFLAFVASTITAVMSFKQMSELHQ